MVAIVMGLAAVVLQFFEYIALDFGASQGGYAVGVLRMDGHVCDRRADRVCTGSRFRSPASGGCGERAKRETEMPTSEDALILVGIETSSFYWAFFVAIGVLAYILLYLVG